MKLRNFEAAVTIRIIRGPAIHALELAKNQKATLKDLREVNNILKKVHEKESRVMFKRLGAKEDLCYTGVCDAS